jgi:pimeloyl-ACP methyl ester carboxylesterase
MVYSWLDPGSGELWYAVRGSANYREPATVATPFRAALAALTEPEVLADLTVVAGGYSGRVTPLLGRAVAAIENDLRARLSGGRRRPSAVVLAGHSLGGSVALKAAREIEDARLAGPGGAIPARCVAFAPFVRDFRAYVAPLGEGSAVYACRSDYVYDNVFRRARAGRPPAAERLMGDPECACGAAGCGHLLPCIWRAALAADRTRPRGSR